MRPAAAALATLALLAGGCDDSKSTSSGGTRAVAVYLLSGGKVSPVRRTVESSPTIARAALAALLAGPTADERADGLETAIPQKATLAAVEVGGGVATVEVGGAVPRSAAERLRETAQIVATLMQFPAVRAVRFGGRTWSPEAIEARMPQIVVESPLPGDRVTSPIHVSGTANVFEATVSLEVRDGSGAVVLRDFTTATAGNGTRGTFDTTLAVPSLSGPATIVAFEESAKDGTPLHVVRVPVVAVS